MKKVIISRETFDVAIGQLRPALTRSATRLCGAAEAEDVVQQSLIKAWVDLCDFDARGGIEGLYRWISAYVRLIAISTRRAERRRRTESLSEPDGPANEEPADLNAIYNGGESRRSALIAELESRGLTPKQRQCALLWLDGLTQSEIGARLGIRQESVRDHLARAKAKLAPSGIEPGADLLGRHWFAEVCDVAIYRAPEKVGSAAARRQLSLTK